MIPDEALEAAAKAIHEAGDWDVPWTGSDWRADVARHEARAALEAAAPYIQRTITTVEELDALPVGSVVLSESYTHYSNKMPISFQRWEGGDWHRSARAGSTHPDNFLPVTVLHEPGE